MLCTVLAISGCLKYEKEEKEAFNSYSESSARLCSYFRGFLDSSVIQSVTLNLL